MFLPSLSYQQKAWFLVKDQAAIPARSSSRLISFGRRIEFNQQSI
jgi:hypothetical protein